MTQFPPEIETAVAVYHLPTTAGQKQPYPSTPDATILGALLPLDRKEHALEGGDYTVAYELYVEATDDVRVSDKLIMDVQGTSTEFYVKSIFAAPFGGIAHKRCSISTEP